LLIAFVVLAMTATIAAPATNAAPPPETPTATRLVSGLASGSGSTVGPDGALYVTEGVAGRVSRVDPQTGAVTTYASGLPPSIVGIGGAMDVAFHNGVAYVLVTLVGPDVGGSSVVGIYRVDDAAHFTVIADIGAWALAHPPATSFSVPTGVQYAMERYRNGFLVTDGHHNRVLEVTLDGVVTELIAFGNIVPTGLELRGKNTVYMAQAGPVPHLPEDGRIVTFRAGSTGVTEVARGGRLLVDVEFGSDALFALAQGEFTPGNPEGSPANPNTGQLLKVVKADGGFTEVVGGLNQPTSLELIGDTAYVVTLGGEIWRIDNV
jgi:sugar lactone lactonase YvrE